MRATTHSSIHRRLGPHRADRHQHCGRSRPGGQPQQRAQTRRCCHHPGRHAPPEALQGIADANDGNRGAGTSGYEASGAYVEQQLRAAGYSPERQYFDFFYEEVHATSLTEVAPGSGPIENNPMSYSQGTGPGGVTGELLPRRPSTCRAVTRLPTVGPTSPARSRSSAVAPAPSRRRHRWPTRSAPPPSSSTTTPPAPSTAPSVESTRRPLRRPASRKRRASPCSPRWPTAR